VEHFFVLWLNIICINVTVFKIIINKSYPLRPKHDTAHHCQTWSLFFLFWRTYELLVIVSFQILRMESAEKMGNGCSIRNRLFLFSFFSKLEIAHMLQPN
jgi:hypothetical protein